MFSFKGSYLHICLFHVHAHIYVDVHAHDYVDVYERLWVDIDGI